MAVPELVDIQVSQALFPNIVIGWKTAPGAALPSGTTVTIYRSYAPNDGYVSIATAIPITDQIYVDSLNNVQEKWLNAYYRLRVTTVISAVTETRDYNGPYHLRDQPDRIGAIIIRNMNMMLQTIGATPVLIYQQGYGTNSTRCPDCWDAVSQQVIYSNCQTCSGTSFVGQAQGYYNPVLTLIDIRPPEKPTVVEDTGQDPSMATARMGPYPLLRPRDVIREINTGVLWKVVTIVQQRKDARAVLTQDPIQLRQIKVGDIEFDLPVPTTLTPVLKRRRPKLERVLAELRNGTPTFIEVWV